MFVFRIGFKVGTCNHIPVFARKLATKRNHIARVVKVGVKPIAKHRAEYGYLKFFRSFEAVGFVFRYFYRIPKFGYFCHAVKASRYPPVKCLFLNVVEGSVYSLQKSFFVFPFRVTSVSNRVSERESYGTFYYQLLNSQCYTRYGFYSKPLFRSLFYVRVHVFDFAVFVAVLINYYKFVRSLLRVIYIVHLRVVLRDVFLCVRFYAQTSVSQFTNDFANVFAL